MRHGLRRQTGKVPVVRALQHQQPPQRVPGLPRSRRVFASWHFFDSSARSTSNLCRLQIGFISKRFGFSFFKKENNINKSTSIHLRRRHGCSLVAFDMLIESRLQRSPAGLIESWLIGYPKGSAHCGMADTSIEVFANRFDFDLRNLTMADPRS